MTAQQVSIGRIVLFTLSDQHATEINRRRTTGAEIAKRIKQEVVTSDNGTVPQWPLGAQAHIGNAVVEGDVVPMVVVRVWSPGCVNGQALLDGNDTLWVTSANEGTLPGQWQWPPRV